MGRITTRRQVYRYGSGDLARQFDVLAVEEPLEIRLDGVPLLVTMRTPGSDVELAAGLLFSEGIISRAEHLRTAMHCGGPGSGGQENTYNVLDIALDPLIAAALKQREVSPARSFYTNSSCGVCGKTSIDSLHTKTHFELVPDQARVPIETLLELPQKLRAGQKVFEKTGGLHAAGLFTADGTPLVIREDIGRHNAADKVVGWALLNDHLPLRGTVLQVSSRASFEIVQKAAIAAVPVVGAVSAASSLAVELAEEHGLTLAGFMHSEGLNIYTHPERVVVNTRG